MHAPKTTAELVRAYYRAYETKDRDSIASLLSEDFRFSSPLDDHIDRASYFAKCWPNSQRIRAFRIERLFERGDEAFVRYTLEPENGAGFRNTEFFTIAAGKITEVEVYFGYSGGTVGENNDEWVARTRGADPA